MARTHDSSGRRCERRAFSGRYKSDEQGRYAFVSLGWLLLLAVVQFGWETPILGLVAYLAVVWALFAVSRLYYDFKINTNPKTICRVARPYRSGRR